MFEFIVALFERKKYIFMSKNISIIVDSGTDMVPSDAEKLGVILIPLTVRFNENEYYDGVNLSRDEFYNKMTQDQLLPKTSQITPYRYQEAFEKEIAKGNDVICLTLSSHISGCYQSAINAASDFEGKVFVVDTLQFCGSEYLLAKRAVELKDAGCTAEEIVETIEKEKSQVRIIALFDTLEYLKKGGRLSASAAFVGSLLSVKPVLRITGGEVDIVAKVRGNKAGNKFLINYINEDQGIDFSKPVVFSYSGNDDENLLKFIEESKEFYQGQDVEAIAKLRVGCTIGTYTGPGAYAIAYYPNKKA